MLHIILMRWINCKSEFRMRGRKLTNKEIDKRLKGTNIKRIGDVVSAGKPLLCQCLVCNHEWSPKATSVLNDKSGCPKCRYPNQRLSIKEVDERLAKHSIRRVGKYRGVLEDIICKCNICKHKWKALAKRVMRGNGCPNCALIKNRLPRLTVKDIDKRLRGTQIKRIGTYTGARDPMSCECSVCGHKWSPIPANLFRGHGCPMCASLKNEKMVAKSLKKYKILFIHHLRLNGIFDINRVVIVDYYLPQFNIIIEYNGRQHYMPVCWNGISKKRAIAKFKKQKERDIFLKNLCKDKGITLICIDGRVYRNKKLEPFMRELIRKIKESK